MNTPDGLRLDLTRFSSVDDAIAQATKSADGFTELAKRIVEISENHLTLLNMFLLSSVQRATGLNLAIVDSVRNTNPHAAFPLLRAYSDAAVMVLYVRSHPDYVAALTSRRGERAARRRKSMGALNKAVAKYAPGLATVYDELSEGAHFGSIAMWMAWIPTETDAGVSLSYTTYPRWRAEEDPLIVCGWLIELNQGLKSTLESFVKSAGTPKP